MENSYWIYLLGIAVVSLGLVFFVRSLFAAKSLDRELTHKEKMFQAVLEKAVGGQYQIFAKVPMAEVFEPAEGRSLRAQKRALKPLRNRMFDYVVCDLSGRKVVCAVELDDHSYDNKQFKKTDLFIEQLCQDANLPLLRVAPQNGYNLVEIIERFERTIAPHSMVDAAHTSARLQVVTEFTPKDLAA